MLLAVLLRAAKTYIRTKVFHTVRKVFFSFHFENDHWRTQQVRNMDALEGNSAVAANKWEEIKKSGDAAIKKWIDDNLKGKSYLIVLVGSKPAQRHWVCYKIKKAWEDKKGVLGIRIHGLKDMNGNTSAMGSNPFTDINVSKEGKLATLGDIPPLRAPSGEDSKAKYASIEVNIEYWIEDAIAVRGNYK